jgi:hypothetical protein
MPPSTFPPGSTPRRRFSCRTPAWRWALLGFAWVIALLFAPAASLAQGGAAGGMAAGPAAGAPGVGEERVKAAYLFRFIGYVEWPQAAYAKADSPYVIGIMNADEVADELVSIVGSRTVNNRPVTVKKLQGNEVPAGLHVLFIGAGERGRQVQLLRQLQQQPVLLVTETDGALSLGSMINFRLVEDRLRFEIALAPAERTGLKFNSKMLGVAFSVNKGTP